MNDTPTAWGSAGAGLDSDIPRQEDTLKEQALFATLARWPALIVAYSGGVDSAYLAWAATRVLGRQALCVTADSASYPDRHRSIAKQIAAEFGLQHEIIRTNEMDRAEAYRQFRGRDPDVNALLKRRGFPTGGN